LRDEVKVLSDELQRAKAEARQASEERQELEERAKAVAGLWDK